MTVKSIPEGYKTITPYLAVKDPNAVDKFLTSIGATQDYAMRDDADKISHASYTLIDSKIMIGDCREEKDSTRGMLYLYVKDSDSLYKKALNAGAKSLHEPEDQFYGDHTSAVTDPAGNIWWFATHVEDVSPDELKKRFEEMRGRKAA